MTSPHKKPAFTLHYNGISSTLITDIAVSEPFAPEDMPDTDPFKIFRGLWDTGATTTCISGSVVAALGLVSIGSVRMHTAGGVVFTSKYIINIGLPNRVAFPFIEVHEAVLFDTDVLIGMDIITRGDFAVSNYEGRTALSFRVPSGKFIDFTGNAAHEKKIGRNEICPKCGSGKKYKNCCGK